ncbi:putative uncharacterized protein DDB_G0272516 [Neodiprion fabricii]|uniref:putative uncharacterized protein DDB_G0272516 n=1 Tax=Neodiprion fabricii TaxID=2872261 RepID=UPI001ED93C2E|nr:putative uncharacterized protein DDB_G0272516 [Neodiprion fabricii]XP_046418608.1 putative uncharacterized protein DDB_G0272516 [Neodiprion fabricii]
MAPTIKRTPVKTRSRITNKPRRSEPDISKAGNSQIRNNTGEMEGELERLKEEMASFAGLRNTIEQLQAQQATNAQLANEVALLKLQNEQQRQALQQIQNPVQQPVTNNDQISVSELIVSLQRSHIDAKAPEFTDEEVINPIEYLENLENYFRLKCVKEECKLSIVESKLSGRAKIWWEASKETINTYNDFKEAFKNKFYSIPIQVKVKTKWSSRRYNQQDGSLQTYFFKQLKEAKYLLPKLDQFEINYTIIQQLPYKIRDTLATVNMADTKIIEQALSQLDVNYEERNNNKHKYQNQSNNNQVNNVNNMQIQHKQQQQINNTSRQQNYPNAANNFYQNPQFGTNLSPWQYQPQVQASTSNQMNLPNVNYPPPYFSGTNNQIQSLQTQMQTNTNNLQTSPNRNLN